MSYPNNRTDCLPSPSMIFDERNLAENHAILLCRGWHGLYGRPWKLHGACLVENRAGQGALPFNLNKVLDMGQTDSIFVETERGGEAVIFAENLYSMIEIIGRDYEAVGCMFRDAIDGKAYFNGTIEYEREGLVSVLKTTVIVYREEYEYPEGRRSRIVNLVPVWWEFTTWLPDGMQVINDFCFGELKRHVLEGA